ncbi:hypothetical protein SVIOM74S_00778 [Streptomyces violarus]
MTLRGLTRLRTIERVVIHDADDGRAHRMAEVWQRAGLACQVVGSAREVAQSCDSVVTATWPPPAAAPPGRPAGLAHHLAGSGRTGQGGTGYRAAAAFHEPDPRAETSSAASRSWRSARRRVPRARAASVTTRAGMGSPAAAAARISSGHAPGHGRWRPGPGSMLGGRAAAARRRCRAGRPERAVGVGRSSGCGGPPRRTVSARGPGRIPVADAGADGEEESGPGRVRRRRPLGDAGGDVVLDDQAPSRRGRPGGRPATAGRGTADDGAVLDRNRRLRCPIPASGDGRGSARLSSPPSHIGDFGGVVGGERAVVAGDDVTPERGDDAVDHVLGDLEAEGKDQESATTSSGVEGGPWRASAGIRLGDPSTRGPT